ncbi:hypothetical protein B4U79_04018, partial [Dinothrombium tinctorium]
MDVYGEPPVPTLLTFGRPDVSPTGSVTPVTPATTTKDPYPVINPKVLSTGSRTRAASTIQAEGGWPIGFDSVIS